MIILFNRWTCKLEKFVFYTSSDVAIWILVLFTVDRFVAVCFPLEKRGLMNVRSRAKILSFVTLLLAVGKNLHVCWTRDIEYAKDGSIRRVCGRPQPYYDYEQFVRPWLAFVFVSVLPFCVILFCNLMIIHTLLQKRRLSRSTMAQLVIRQHHSLSQSKKATFTQTTLMCLSASLAFVVCVTPSIVLTIGRVHWIDGPHKEVYFLAKVITHQLSCLNHAINFSLYCLSGQRFRQQLLLVLRLGNTRAIMRLNSRFTSSVASRHLPMSPVVLEAANMFTPFTSSTSDNIGELQQVQSIEKETSI
jgi:hypothetical protein